MLRDGLRRGLSQPVAFIVLLKGAEGCIIGFVATYAFTLRDNLTLIGAISAVLGVLLSVKDLATRTQNEMLQESPDMYTGLIRPRVIAEMLPRRCTFTTVFAYVQTLAEFTVFSVCCRVLHPVVVIAAFAVGAGVAIFTDENCTNYCTYFWSYLIYPPSQYLVSVLPQLSMDDWELASKTKIAAHKIFICVRITFLMVLSCNFVFPTASFH